MTRPGLALLARDLAPYLAELLGTGGGGSSGASGGMAKHDLGGPYHNGLLAQSQAPWAATASALNSHANNENAHHARLHALDSVTDHSGTLGWGRLNKAGSNLADLEWRAHASLTSVTADQHHTHATAGNAEITVSAEQVITLGSHDILARHTVTGGANLDVIGQTGAGVLARLTPSGDVSAEASGGSLLRSAAGTLALKSLSATVQVSTPRLTYSGNLTIDPTGDLTLNPGGGDVIVSQADALRSDNYLAGFPLAGWRIGPTGIAGQSGVNAGVGEFDELRARLFVADETRVDRGQEYITKSYGVLSRAFTVPAAVGGTAYLYVENSPHIAGAVFSVNDWVLLRYLDMSSGIVLTSVWGQVSAYYITGLTGEQRWTFTLRQGTGSLDFGKGAMVVNFGASGQGYILSDAVSSTAPFVQIGKWTTNPYTPANRSVLTHIGRLDGVGFTGEVGLAAGVTGFDATDAWVKVSSSGALLNNVPILMYNGAVNTASWSANGQLDIGFDGVSAINDRDFTVHMSGYVRIGRVGTNLPNLYYSAGTLHLRQNTTPVITLASDGSSYFAGPMTIGTAGGIWQGTGSFASPTTGLKLWNQSGVGRIAGYNAGVLQWYANTDGKLYAGGGAVVLDASGISVLAAAAVDWYRSYSFNNNGGAYGGVQGSYDAAFGNLVVLYSGTVGNRVPRVEVLAEGSVTYPGQMRLGAYGNGLGAEILLNGNTRVVSITAASISTSAPLVLTGYVDTSQYVDAGAAFRRSGNAGYIYIPVTPVNLTDTTAEVWDGTATRAVGTYIFDLAAAANGSIPTSAAAIVLLISGQWTAANGGYSLQARPRTGSVNYLIVRASAANINNDAQGIVALDATYKDIQIVVAGAQATTCVARLLGYFM